MRSLIACLLAVVAVLFAGACKESSQPTTTAAAGGPSEIAGSTLTIAVTVPAADHGWTAGVGWWARKAMAQHPQVHWVYATADKPEKQIADIKDMMAQQKLDGLVILCTESAPLTPIAREVHDNGIYIVNVDRGFLEPIADVFLEGDNKAFGRKSAEFIAERMGGRGNLVILRGIPCTVDTDRYEAAMEVFTQHPDIKILGVQPGYWNRQKGLEVMQTFLQHKQIDAVWAQDDDMAEGAEQAIKEAGRDKEMWIFGGAGKKDIVKRVMDRDPMYPADITYPPAMIAAGIHTCVYKLGGIDKARLAELMPAHISLDLDDVTGEARHIKLDVDLITPENARKYYFPDSVF